MPTYAILGVTGAAGSSVLRHLLTRTPTSTTRLHLFVRSSKKLLHQNPGLATHPYVSIFEATLDQKTVVAQAIRGADYIFACTGDNESPPQLSVSLDTANAVGYALQTAPDSPTASGLSKPKATAQKHQPSRKPTLVMLSSACISSTPTSSPTLRLLRALLRIALANSCADLRRAEARYRALAAAGLVRVVFAQPGSLMAAPAPTGHALCTARSSLMLGYPDLGPGMVEMAEHAESSGYAGRGVSVNATGRVRATPGPLVQYLVSGIVARFWPGAWPWGRRAWRRVQASWLGLDARGSVNGAKVEA